MAVGWPVTQTNGTKFEPLPPCSSSRVFERHRRRSIVNDFAGASVIDNYCPKQPGTEVGPSKVDTEPNSQNIEVIAPSHTEFDQIAGINVLTQ